MEQARGPPRVKNKAPSAVQISAEQLLREAVDRQEEKVVAPTQRFADLEELHEYQGRKRREFEDYVRRSRVNMRQWMQYASWELEQKEYRRARSIFERALDVSSTNVQLWLRYIDAEVLTRNINHARNLLDRAVTILPRIDKLWYKYVHMEQTLGNIAGARQVFERWVSWESEGAWSAFISMEKKYGELQRVRQLYERYTLVHPEPETWLKWSRFEQEYGTSDLVREVFGIAIETLEDHMDERIFKAYARFEASLGEYDRARAIYKFALDRLPRSRSQDLHKAYTTFEKQHGDSEGVEDVILSKRRVHYEEAVTAHPKDYDAWIDYARLEEESAALSTSPNPHDQVCDVYERAIAQLPPSHEKRHWRRYIYLWLFYAIYSETSMSDPLRARAVYAKALQLVPHTKFTFTKLWLQKAHFEIRQLDVIAARKTLGQALGRCPKDSLYKAYIALELRLFDFTRARTLHSKRVDWDPSNSAAWIAFAELERGLDEPGRARGLFEIAAEHVEGGLDMPELLWKSWIDFEEDEGEYANVHALYEKLLQRTNHVKVWTSYAQFALTAPDDESDAATPADENEDDDEEEEKPISPAAIVRARSIFTRAAKSLSPSQTPSYDPDTRAHLLHAWRSFEATHGDAEAQAAVTKIQPRRIKKRRKVSDSEYEEFAVWVFPEDEGEDARAEGGKLAALLAKARAWKEEERREGGEDGGVALG